MMIKVEQLALTFVERQKSGGEYSARRAQAEKHVVVVSTTLRSDTTYDFLNEFFSHSRLQVRFLMFNTVWNYNCIMCDRDKNIYY